MTWRWFNNVCLLSPGVAEIRTQLKGPSPSPTESPSAPRRGRTNSHRSEPRSPKSSSSSTRRSCAYPKEEELMTKGLALRITLCRLVAFTSTRTACYWDKNHRCEKRLFGFGLKSLPVHSNVTKACIHLSGNGSFHSSPSCKRTGQWVFHWIFSSVAKDVMLTCSCVCVCCNRCLVILTKIKYLAYIWQLCVSCIKSPIWERKQTAQPTGETYWNNQTSHAFGLLEWRTHSTRKEEASLSGTKGP